MLHACDASSVLSDTASVPPLAFLKSHKTGSSTLESIIHRVLDARSLRKMLPQARPPAAARARAPDAPPNASLAPRLPCPHAAIRACDSVQDIVHLGYPGAFPGGGQPPPRHQFDAICNHAVLDVPAFASYLRTGPPPPLWFTVLRESVSRAVSAFNYFDGHPRTWAEHLQKLERAHRVKGADDPWFVPRFGNALAYDLGWYKFAGGSTEHDHDQQKIDEFVAQLDQQLDVVIILEELDKGLVLLGRAARLSPAELTYQSMLKQLAGHQYPFGMGNKVLPNTAQETRIRELLAVDGAIYDHFAAKFASQWAAAVAADPTHLDDLSKLRCLNDRLGELCAAGDADCHRAYLTDEMAWGKMLKKNGGVHAFNKP